MSRRYFGGTDNAELRAKIDEAKGRLPMPELLAKLGLGEHAKKTAHCLWHDDQHPSFSVFQGADGFWHYKCFVCDMQGGDEIAFLVKHLNVSRREAISRYLEIAGFPTHRPKSREYPEAPMSLTCPESPKCLVSPVSNGQDLETELKELAARNACKAPSTARMTRWQLLRYLKAVEERIGRKLTAAELMLVFDGWYQLSLPFLDFRKTRDDYWALFLAELNKVRVPAGEGETLTKALENVSKLALDQLPAIPGYAEAPEDWRRLAALHRELSHSSLIGIYFLSYRDAAKVCDGLTHQAAYTITGALVTLGAIKIVEKGKAGSSSRKAAEFQYLLSQTDNGEAVAGVRDERESWPPF